MSGFKFTTDRLTLFLGASAPGGLNLKPRLAYHYENPMAFKNEANFLLVLFKQKNKTSLYIDGFMKCCDKRFRNLIPYFPKSLWYLCGVNTTTTKNENWLYVETIFSVL